MIRAGLSLAFLASLLVASAGCGGAAVCGDGDVEGTEQCDDGNEDETDACRACLVYVAPRATVKWEFNQDPARGFDGDSCSDTGVARVRVELVGATTMVLEDACSNRQVAFVDAPLGTYAVNVTPLDNAGVAMVSAPAVGSIEATAESTEVTVNVPWDRWLPAFTGTYYFRATWDGQPCGGGMGPAQQRLTLRVRDAVVSNETDTGQRLDGSELAACVPSTAQFPQTALDVPFGPAELTIEGLDGGGTVLISRTFDTFVGAGRFNPTFEFDVAADVPDAAPADAAVVDASLPDAP